ncbi:MAG: DMT family transporter [Raoultibacter sp.]
MNANAKYKLKGFIFMFLSSSAMGGIGAFGRYINAPGDFISFGRNFLGFIALTVVFLFLKGSFKKIKTTRFSLSMLFSGIFLGLLSGLYVISTQYTTLANASFLIYTGPIYSTILAAIFLKEKINIKGILCIAAVVLGMLFIVGIITPQGLTLDLDPKWMFGNMIGLLSGVAYGLYLFVARYREDCDSNVRSWWNFLFASITILGLMLVDNFLSGGLKYTVKINGVQQVDASGQIMTADWNLFTMDPTSWLVWIAAALITGFIAFHLLAYATKMLKAGELAAISYQETIMASVLGFFMFGEMLTPLQLVGGALIIIGGVSQIFFSTKAASQEQGALASAMAAATEVGGAGGAGMVDGTPQGYIDTASAEKDAAKAKESVGAQTAQGVKTPNSDVDENPKA